MISLIVVNYRSAVHAVEAIRTAREGSSEPLHVIVVDNSEDAHEVSALQDHADLVLASRTNRGYAGAINDARVHVAGDVVIVSNPDVAFAARSIDVLVAAARSGAAVAGPALFWDDGFRWPLPPADLHSAPQLFGRLLAGRSPALRTWRDRRRTLARISFWRRAMPLRTTALSGAVLAITTDAFDRVGGFDERFRLYFEENDFLRRVAAARLPVVYVPGAQCRHVYNQSAGTATAMAAAFYADSERKYSRKWNGPFLAGFFERTLRPLPPLPIQGIVSGIEVDPETEIVEISPLDTFETAAGHLPVTETVTVPASILDSHRGSDLFVRRVEAATGAVRAVMRLSP